MNDKKRKHVIVAGIDDCVLSGNMYFYTKPVCSITLPVFFVKYIKEVFYYEHYFFIK